MLQKLFLYFVFLLPATVFAESNAGNTGMAFLKIGAGSRAISMGEAYTAVTNDASATYWNPAGLTQLTKSQFIFTHNKWFQDISHEFAAVAFSVGKSTFGISFISNNVGGIERRIKPSTEPLGIIEAHDIMVGLSYARALRKNFTWGVTLKYLYEKIYLDTAFGFGADFGLLYHTPVNGLTFGATVQNIGKMSQLHEESTSLPITMKGGIAYAVPIHFSGKILIAADVLKIVDGTFHSNWGIEYQLIPAFALRFGYLTGHEDRNFQGGFGLKFSRYQLDYGYVPFSSDLGNSHRLSFSFNF